MKTRIATSFGLALVLVFGIVGVLIAFGPQEAQADHSLPHPPTAIKAEATPNDPNTVAKWTIEFINGQVADIGDPDPDMLAGGTGNDFVIIEFEDDVQFPESIDSRHITITATDPRSLGDEGYFGTLVANPLGQPTIEKVAEYSGANPQLAKTVDETQVTLNIPDMEPSDENTGSQGIRVEPRSRSYSGRLRASAIPLSPSPTKATASLSVTRTVLAELSSRVI